VRYGILGPLFVSCNERQLSLGALKDRTVLGVLLLHANEVVPRQRLIEELWGASPPPTAVKTVNTYVSQLRKALAGNGSEPIATRPPGYLIKVGAGELDAHEFAALTSVARTRAQAGALEEASALYANALALWRGRAMSGIDFESVARHELERLDESRVVAVMDRIDCELALGRHDDLVGELEVLVAEHPLRERLYAQQMLALYRSGRQADALRAYQQARAALVHGLGLEPSPALQRLERGVLNHDASLQRPSGTARRNGARAAETETVESPEHVPQRPRRPRAGRVAIGVAALVAASAAAAGFALRLTAGGDRPLAGNGVAVLDSSGRHVAAAVSLEDAPSAVAALAGALWASSENGTLLRIPSGAGPVERLRPGRSIAALAAGAGALWLVDPEQRLLLRFDPATRAVVQRIGVGNGAGAVAVGGGTVWVANARDGTVTEVDNRSGRVERTIDAGGLPSGVTVGRQAVWVSDAESGTVAGFDLRTGNRIATAAIGGSPTALAAFGGSVWVANPLAGTVSRINDATGQVTATLPIRGGIAELAVAQGRIWVLGPRASLTEVDPARQEVIRQRTLGAQPVGVADTGTGVALALTTPESAHRGGTLRRVGRETTDPRATTLDPATWWTGTGLAILALTNDGLVTLRRAPGPAGSLIVPDLAASLPTIADDGRTYTFRLRQNIHYSDSRPVRASDVRATLERLWRMRPTPAPTTAELPLGLVGEAACRRAPARCDLARGVVTDDKSGTVVLHLVRQNPLLLQYLATPFYDILPRGTPPRDGKPLPATGPYRITRWVRGRLLVLERNKHFRVWSVAAQPAGNPDRIVWRIGISDKQALEAVLAGRADVLDQPRWTPEGVQKLALHAPSHLRTGPLPSLVYLWLNTRVAPFDNQRARQAVAMAIDRPRIAALQGGPLVVRPACSFLLPGFPGYSPACRAPDIGTARRLVRRSGTVNARVVVWADSGHPESVSVATYLAHTLRRIGYRAGVRRVGSNTFYSSVTAPHNRSQAGIFGWYVDDLDGGAVIRPLLTCGSPYNISRFCDRPLDSAIQSATTLEETRPAAAARAWARIDTRARLQAPLVPLTAGRWAEIFATRVGNVLAHPYLGVLLDQLSVR
jgi:peptide/nickel transport system substrate-binding protein